jgi:hypothetical protein
MEVSMPSAAEENNKTIFIRAIGNWNKGNLSEYLQLYDPGVVLHGYMGVVESSLEGVKKFYQRFWAAFPGLHITIDDMIAEGDSHLISLRLVL